MPFTPLHMGPGILLKAVLHGSFSLMVFGWAQIIMDIQPLIVMLSGEGHLHGFTHTYIGATLLGAVAAVTGKYVAEAGLRLIDAHRFLPVGWAVALFSAFVGAYSHVLLDSLMHADLQPFAPFLTENPFLDRISIETLHKICIYSGLAGAGLYFAVARYLLPASRRSPQ